MNFLFITTLFLLIVVGVYADCQDDGVTYKREDSWNKPSDPCVTCECTDDGVVCAAIMCRPPSCAQAVKREGTCCDFDCNDIPVTGKVVLPNYIQTPLPTGSCLVVFVQKSIQCFTCDNPKLDIAKMHNPVIKNNEISYKLILPGKTKPGIFNIQATLNVGWCKAGNEWIRDGDYKQIYSNEFAIVSNQRRKKVSGIKMEYYGKNPPLKDTAECTFSGKTYQTNQKFISGDCTRECECKRGGDYYCVSLCPPIFISCDVGYQTVTEQISVPGSNCSCERPKCVKSEDEEQVVIDGKINVPSTVVVRPNSCLIVTVEKGIQCDTPTCESTKVASVTTRSGLSGKDISYSLHFSKIEEGLQSYYISAILNNGWCAEDSREQLRSGDFHTVTSHEFDVTTSRDRLYKYIAIEEFKASVDLKPDSDSGAVAGLALPLRTVTIVGYLTLSEDLSQLALASCLNVFFRENRQCSDGALCNVEPLAQRQFKNPGVVDGKIRYEIKVRNTLPGIYLVEGVLNVGWCNSPTSGSSEWIRNGDYKSDFVEEVRIGESSPSVVRKDIKLVVYRTSLTETEKECPTNLPIVTCDRNPCEGALCYGYPAATCRSNFCGGCYAKFYHGNNKVTCQKDECPNRVPIVNCATDPCSAAKCRKYPTAKCYSNFCGGCNAEFYVGYTNVDCNEEKKTTTVSGQCAQEQKEIQSRNNGILLGQYRPQCEDNGDYKQMQCQEGYCWCVEPENGKKLTEKGTERGIVDCSGFCEKPCSSKHKPVCGSNGQTYSSECEFNNAKCKDGSLRIKNYFTCRDGIPKCVKPCTREYKPVCGTDGKTYPNKCEFNNAKCKDNNLKIKNEFACNTDIDSANVKICSVKSCTREYNPICASNWQTFPNKCEFDNAKCKDDSLQIKYYFQCRPDISSCVKPCTKEYKPVCGNDGKTYTNECEFKNAKCKLTELKIRSYFICKDDKEEKVFSVKIVGYVKLEPVPNAQLLPGSCINIVVRDSRQCSETDECGNRILAKKQIKGERALKVTGGKLRYSVKLSDGQPGTYEMEVVVNNGWCRQLEGKEYLRNGDYHNDISEILVIRKGNTRQVLRKDIQSQHFKATPKAECPKGVPIVGCAVNPCDSATCALYTNALCQANFCGGCFAEFYVNGWKVTCDSNIKPTKPVYVSGNIVLPSYFTRTSLPSGSCIKMLIQENIQCSDSQEECGNPVYATIQLNDPPIKNNKIKYNMLMKEAREGSFVISATLNMGWCTSGKEWLRIGDYKNEFIYDFTLSKDQNEVSKDVHVARYDVKPNEKSTVDFTTVEVTGFVTIPNDVRSPLPVGSCLNMFVQESIFCLYCNNPVLGRARISNPTITNRKTPYKIKLKDIKGKNQFLVQATLNVGWCGVGDEWIRYNDFHNEYLHEFSLEKDQNKASRDVDLVRYQSKKPIAFNDKGGVSVTGDVVLPYGSPIRFPEGTCLNMYVQENILCLDCDIPILATFKTDNIQIVDRRIPFKMVLNKPKPGQYLINAVLNKGWCKTEDEWIRVGDYQNEFSVHFDLGKGQLSAQMDVDIEEYKSATKPTHAKSNKDVIVKGHIKLPPKSASTPLSAGSCLRVFIQENVQCEYCVNPILAEVVVRDPKVVDSQIAYQITLHNTEEDGYIINVFINNGWCGNKKETIRYGDFGNNIVNSFSLTSGETEVDQDVVVEEYINPASIGTVSGPKEAVIVCYNNGKTYKADDTRDEGYCTKCTCVEGRSGGDWQCVSGGDCVKDDKAVVCYDNGNTYKLGDTRDGDDCTTCTCVAAVGRGEWGCIKRSDCVKGSCSHGGKQYKVGESRFEDCNTCTCGEASNWACTIAACQVGVCYKDGVSYQNGHRYFNGCNHCTCSVSNRDAVGYFGCTSEACPYKAEGCTHNKQKYKTGESRYEQCNSCICGATGEWGCTEIGCGKGVCYHSGQPYKDGQSFKDDCNTCRCSASDKDKFGVIGCTLMLCPPKTSCETLRDGHGAVPLPGAYVPSCKDDGAYEELQCDGSVGSCWCVDSKTGKEISDTRVSTRDRIPPPDCSQYCIKPCPKIYKPVCGTDGRTYGNICEFNNAKCKNKDLKIRNYFTCNDDVKPAPPKDECPKDVPIVSCSYRPCAQRTCVDRPNAVCKDNYCGGCNAVFYENGKKVECKETKCHEACPYNYDPVCGSDGKTYSNRCGLEVVQCKDQTIYMEKQGPCDDECPEGVPIAGCVHNPCAQLFCDDEPTAVCKPNFCGGCKADFYKNGKKITCAKTKCLEGCPFNYDPVCGSDGKTYSNLCILKAAQCKDPQSIYIKNKGDCPGPNDLIISGKIFLPSNTPSVLPPDSCLNINIREEILCDSEDCTVPLLANLKILRPKMERGDQVYIPYTMNLKDATAPTYVIEATLNVGWCKTGSEWIRNGDYNNDVSHTFTKPESGNNVDLDVKITKYEIKPQPKKECLIACPAIYSPQCGSDGKTYSNKCVLVARRSCEDSSLKLVHTGKCEECPRGVPITGCTFSPCAHLSCNDEPTAVCKPNFCGRCKAEFYKDGKKITCGKTKCSERCPFNFDPVCGSDGKTYSNLCAFEVAQCKDETNLLYMAKEGLCGTAKCRQVVEAENAKADGQASPGAYVPQCNNDGTYKNRQCHGSIGSCWCVDKIKGTEIPGTRKKRGEGEVTCPIVELIVSGKVTLPAKVPSILPPDSCLNVKIQELIVCQSIHCKIPVVSSLKIDRPTIEKGEKPYISYKMYLKKPTAPGYTVGATLNVGWCNTGREWIKNGDYTNNISHEFTLPKDRDYVDLDIILTKYGTKPQPPTKTDCQWKVEAENKRGNGKSLLGAYVPQCKEDGSYEKKQCHGSTGYCWCVDEQTGKEITGTKKGPGQGEVECPSVANVSPSECPEGTPLTSCTFDPCAQVFCEDEPKAVCKANYCGGCKAEFYKDGKKITCVKSKCSEGCPFNYDPVCGSDGKTYSNLCTFQVAQCKDKSKSLYMATEGDCAVPKSKCHTAVEAENAKGDGRPLLGAYVPQCHPDGSYKERQCHSSIGSCWCVNRKTGVEITGTRRNRGEGVVTCSSNDLKISGKVILPLNTPRDLPPDSCLKLDIREEILCDSEDCDVPSVSSMTIKEPTLSSADSPYISYTMSLKNPTNINYIIEATLNVGWCSNGKEPIRKGDFKHDDSYQFSAPKHAGDNIHLDIFLTKSESKPTVEKTAVVDAECPEGTPIVACSYQPCAQLFCENEPKAVCKPHFCGGCSAEFFVGNKKITCAKRKCSQVCPLNYAPICGNDGKTYPNQCSLEVAQCLEEPKSLQAAYDGRCKANSQSKCQAERNTASNRGPLVGVFVPKCKNDGSYEKRQCHGSTGYCWCVNEITGEEIAGTKQRRGQYVDCSDNSMTKCQAEKDAADSRGGRPMVGGFTPQCSSNGSYERKQCHGSTGYCWCVNEKTGKEIAGTKKGPGQGTVDCSGNSKRLRVYGDLIFPPSLPSLPPNSCLNMRIIEEVYCRPGLTCHNPTKASLYTKDPKVEGSVIHYEINMKETSRRSYIIQATLNIGWCKSGDEWIRLGDFTTQTSHAFSPPKSGNDFKVDITLERYANPTSKSKCQTEKDAANSGGTRPLVGAYVPQCKNDGSYEKKQCHSSTGYCWCVDEKSGKEIDATKKGPGQGTVDCSGKGNCLRACTYLYDPVCTSDGRTISNKCLFDIEKCKTPLLTIARRGSCSDCPKDEGTFNCFANPCDVSTCPAHPKAKCKSNYCGGCNAVFSVDGQKVDCLIKKKALKTFRLGELESCSMSCTDEYKPVCSSLRKTLSSECHLRLAACTTGKAIFKMHDGACGQCQKHCTREYKPKCGTDGNTYTNQCEMNKKICETSGQVGFAYDGRCDAPRCPVGCIKLYKPQCGSDGITYSNLCQLQSKSCSSNGKVKFNHPGKCRKCSPICTRQYDPYCGTDGRTYSNECMMNFGVCQSGGSVQIKYKGTCGKPSCPKKCNTGRSLVCGSDGRTYGNVCLLQQKTCRTNGNVYMKYFGTCNDRCKRYRSCPYHYRPVCGTDGKTYSNFCLLRGAMCRSDGVIRRAYTGKCHTCPKGSNVVRCLINPCETAYCAKYPRATCQASYCEACKAEFYLGGRKLQNCGTDCNRACTREYFPQCGNDGKTYGNPCTLNVARCMSKGNIRLAYPGECKTTFYK